jgi:hypothetical protein
MISHPQASMNTNSGSKAFTWTFPRHNSFGHRLVYPVAEEDEPLGGFFALDRWEQAKIDSYRF